jgi:hypothetical protein
MYTLSNSGPHTATNRCNEVVEHLKRPCMHIALWFSPGNLGSWERLACSIDLKLLQA